jgi:hypothetical protein
MGQDSLARILQRNYGSNSGVEAEGIGVYVAD